jgi:XTP/dITP diphosphohydrolase
VKRLIVASTNTGKAREIQTILAPLDAWQVASIGTDLPDVEETGSTFIENAGQKAEFYSRITNELTVADDSGLVVDALEGRPGIYSARYAPTDADRNKRLLEELVDTPEAERTAAFVCALALALAGTVIWSVEERVRGRIAVKPAGSEGFGYDPIFFAPEFGRTMGELEPEVKNRISHRGRALARLKEYLETL